MDELVGCKSVSDEVKICNHTLHALWQKVDLLPDSAQQALIMTGADSESKGKITKAERRELVGYRPKGGDRSTPQVNIAGKWLAEAGFEVGTGVSLKVLDGCLVLIPDSHEETRLRRELAQLEQQTRKIEQTRLKV